MLLAYYDRITPFWGKIDLLLKQKGLQSATWCSVEESHYHFYKKGKSLKLQISCRPHILKGDNWWRGHARAFLKYVNLPAEALRQGRVCQKTLMVNINHLCHSDNLTPPGSTHYGHSSIVQAARGSI
nr:Sn1-specific diacylglycerol lipase beta [Tanacetum cinerariifolium]